MVSPTFRVRSIYDVALIKLVSENLNFELVQPLSEQLFLFKIEEKLAPYDIEIQDILGGYGISVEGDEEYVSSITALFHKQIPNSIILQHPIQLHAVYNGKVVHVNSEKNLSVIDIGENVNAILFGSSFHRGQKVVVQIKQLNIFEDQLPVCSTVIHFPGQSVILERDANFVRVSRKLPKEDRDKLFELGKSLRPQDHGLIMRTSATKAPQEAIQADIDQLVQRAEELDLLISGSSYGPGILQAGQTVAHVLLVKDAKERLTEIRNKVIPTIPMYHWFMAYSQELKLTTTFAERIAEDLDRNKISTILKDIILETDFSDNSIMYLQEYKLTSPPQERILGQLSWSDDVLIIKRSFRSSRGVHYSLDIDISQGDASSIIAKENSWSLHMKILRDSNLLGETVKIVTPIELCSGGKLRYIDLGLLLVKKGEEIKTIDEGLIDYLTDKGIISTQLKEKIHLIFEECQKQLSAGEEHILVLSE
ncbi:MAG: ribonuclease E/G [Candidatus Heimdallarchaeota archaeon]|nr:ribonuclease E/G [Candidatus Heimdallarchaeota archaeon]MCK5142685.1 ribonuclease E/G [Candidatus Heimdallarchaeota archaeon]